MRFKVWLETEEPQKQKKASYYLPVLGLPSTLSKNPDAYKLLEEAAERARGEGNPEAEEAYRYLHSYLDRVRGGKHFHKFFADVSRGDPTYRPQGEYQPELDMSGHEDWMRTREQYHGHFDQHIKTSIPTFGDLQDKKGHAIVRAFGQDDLWMLDIGGSEGSFSRTITHLSNGKIKTHVLDPNDAMHDFYQSKGQTEGSEYIKAAFMRGWMNDDGTRMPDFHAGTTPQRYDIIHESMAFQFISNQRDAQVSEAKALLKPTGMFLTEQKLKTDDWDANEAFKDTHWKDKYYSKDALKKKEKVVAFQAEKKPFQQSQDEEEAVGMVNNMVHHTEYENTLASHFAIVYQYWDSGNFKGYVAADGPGGQMVSKFLSALGNVSSKFSRVQLPRRIERVQESIMGMPYSEWVKKHGHIDHHVKGHLPNEKDVGDMNADQIIEKFGQKIKQAADELGIDLDKHDLYEIIDRIYGTPDMPEFHRSHYDLHC